MTYTETPSESEYPTCTECNHYYDVCECPMTITKQARYSLVCPHCKEQTDAETKAEAKSKANEHTCKSTFIQDWTEGTYIVDIDSSYIIDDILVL